MQHLLLRPGPMLVLRPFRPRLEDVSGRLNEVDVTRRAHEFLFEFITIHVGTTLSDVFRLMEVSPLLQQLYRQDFAEELCAEARKGAVAAGPQDPASIDSIEFLELYQHWGLDSSTNEYSGTQRLNLHGIGPELSHDAPREGRKKGERIEWSVSLTPLRELLPLPIRVNSEVRITEDDANAKAYMHEIRRGRHPDITLGQVIHGLLWELSFHGGPQEQQDVSKGLKRQLEEINAGAAELVSGDDIFDPLDHPGCDAMFDDLGGHSPHEIATAIRDIDDAENAAAWIDKTFGGEVVVKAKFRDRTGHEFRKAFRAAAR